MFKDKVALTMLLVFAAIYTGNMFLSDLYYFGQHDGKMYFTLASNSLIEGAFSCGLYQQSHWPPAWVELTAGLYRIFGHHPIVVRIFLTICAMAVGVLVYLWSQREFGKIIGRVALFLALASAYMLKFTTFHQYEIFISLCMLLTSFLIFQKFRTETTSTTKNVVMGVVTGLAMSACVLSSSKTVLVAVGLALCLYYFSWQKKQWSMAVLYSLIGITVFGLWVNRNYQCFDKFIPLTTNGGIVFYMANGPGTNLKAYSNPYEYEEHITPQNTMNYDSEKWYQHAREYIKAHPWVTAKRTAARFVLFMNPHYVDQIFGVLLFLSSLILLIRNKYPWKTKDPIVWLSIVMVFWVLHSFYQYEPRYVLPVWPFMVLFGVGSLNHPKVKNWLQNKFAKES